MKMGFVRKYAKVLAFFAIILLVVVLNGFFGWVDIFSSPESLPALQQALEENLLKAMLIYIAVSALGCALLALPGVIFAVAAGVLFGPLRGTIVCAIATTLGACLAFLGGRYFLRDAIKPIVMKNKYIRRFFFDESGKNYLFLLMITRLVPLFPYNLQNFAYGITDVGFWPYMLYSFIFMLPGTAAYTIAAAGVVDSQNRALYLGTAFGLLAVVTVLTVVLKKHSLGKVQDEEPMEDAEN